MKRQEMIFCSMELISIGKFAKIVGVTTTTLRRMHERGELVPCHVSSGGTRYYSSDQLSYFLKSGDKRSTSVVGYCRICSDDLPDDLQQQKNNVKNYMCAKGYQFSLIEDIGSGIDYRRQGLCELIAKVNNREISKIVIFHRDILAEFGFELIEYFCSINNVTIEIIDDTGQHDEHSLVNDLIQIAALFSGGTNLCSEKTVQFIDKAKVCADGKIIGVI